MNNQPTSTRAIDKQQLGNGFTYSYDGCTVYSVLQSSIRAKNVEDVKKIIEKENLKYQHSFTFNCNKVKFVEIHQHLSQIGNIFLSETAPNNGQDYYIVQDKLNNFFIYASVYKYNYKLELKFCIFTKVIEDIPELEKRIRETFLDITYKDNTDTVSIKYFLIDKQNAPYQIDLDEKVETKIKQINYPFMENIEQYTNDYIQSNEPLLFLLGPPGTGKTRYIRYLLSKINEQSVDKYNSEIWFTSDKAVIEHGIIFTDFMLNKGKILLLEDFDFHLNSRKEGNTIMYHLLGSSDGLIQNKDRKIIISSNLPNLSNIDEALIRYGRCFGIMEFRKLTYEESIEFFKSNNKEDLIKKLKAQDYSLAELYHILNSENKKELDNKIKKVGF